MEVLSSARVTSRSSLRHAHRSLGGAAADIAHACPGLAVLAAFEGVGRGPAASHAGITATAGHADDGQGADRHCFGEFILDPGEPVLARRQDGAVGHIVVRQHPEGEVAAARGQPGIQRGHGSLRELHGQDRDLSAGFACVGIKAAAGRSAVLESADLGEGRGELDIHVASLYLHGAPDQFLHAFLGGDPGTCRRAETGAGRDAHLETERVGEPGGKVKTVFPDIAHILGIPLASGQIELMETDDADPLEPVEVGPDTGLGHVVAHPVPPDTDAGFFRGILETRLKIFDGDFAGRSSLAAAGRDCSGNGKGRK